MNQDQFDRVNRWLKEAGSYVAGTIGYVMLMENAKEMTKEHANEAIKRLKRSERAICAALQPFCGQMYEQNKEEKQ